MPQQITWEELIQLEPGLLELYREIKAVKDDKSTRSFCANAHWYGALPGTDEERDETIRRHGTESWNAPPAPPRSFKDHMSRLVGWHAKQPRLRTTQAYHVAYQKLYNALPNCRNCACMPMSALIFVEHDDD